MTKVEIINLALTHIGHANSIADTDEESEEARIMNRWFDVAHEELLSFVHWKFARKTRTLVLVEEDPTNKWSYSYRQPADCIMAFEIPFASATGSLMFDVTSNRDLIPFDKSFDSDGVLIYTNAADADLEYTAKPPDSILPIYYCITLSYLLASYAFSAIAKGDMAGMSAKLYDVFEEKRTMAAAKNSNETINYKSNESAFTLARR